MKEFSFICISYNQQKEIVEHLESIRQLVERFGGNTENDLIVADDGSADGTAAVAREWIGRNRGLFRRAEVLPETANMGTVRNIYRAIDSCRTENFKILAGDDKYNLCDIYALYDSLGDDIVITPVLPFGNFGSMGKKLIESF
ncbi:MAG: glycosyltransferase, partial [Ruminococcus sp.]|nr:glycosyltransferase [Ruminococcus sp.]